MGLKEVKIKTGTVRRLGKELISYRKEADRQNERIAKLKSDNADIHDIRKQNEVLEETMQMIPDCQRRLSQAHAELKEMIERDAAEIAGSEEKLAAETVIAEISEQEK